LLRNAAVTPAGAEEAVEQGNSLPVCLSICVQRAALKAPPPFGHTLSLLESARSQPPQEPHEFLRIVRSRDSTAWPSWLQSAKGTALASFAAHLIRDQAAVLAALQTPWSNGQVEGQVHRLKLVKRQMYGRASFDLLRLRVLNTA
jgi:transposase